MCNSFQMLFNDVSHSIQKDITRIPELKDGEILVKNKYVTLCGSDIHTYTGKRKEPSPIVLGHEIVGEIVALGSNIAFHDLEGTILKIGDIVTWTIFSTCEDDEFVRDGIPQKSKKLFKYGHVQFSESNSYNGGLATHCVLREGTAILKLPASIPLKLAPIINCAGATVMACFRIIENIKHKNVLIIGAGVLGLIAAAVAKKSGAATVTLMDVDKKRLEQAKVFGADFTCNIKEEKTQIENITNKFYKNGFDVVIDMSGSWEAMKLGLELSATGAQNIWVGGVTPMNDLPINPEQIIRKILTIKGMHNYNHEDFLKAVKFFEKHSCEFPFINFIEAEYPLEHVEEAFQYAVKNKPFRVLIANER